MLITRTGAVCAGMILVASAISMGHARAATPKVEADASVWSRAWSSLPISQGNPVFRGTVVAADKSSMDSTVVLFGLLNPGKSTPQTSDHALLRATTDASGAWQLAVPADLDLTPYTDNGIANFEIASFTAEGSDLHFASARVATTKAGVNSRSSQVTTTTKGLAAARLTPIDSAPITLNSEGARYEGASTDASWNSVTPADGPTSVSCADSDKKYYPNIPVQVAATYSNGNGVAYNFSYAQGASSSLGAAVNEGDGFKESGTVSKSASGTQTFPTVKNAVNRGYFTYFTYEKYKHHCVVTSRGQVIDKWTYQMFTPHSYDAGDELLAVPPIKAGQCIPELKGDSFHLHKSKAPVFAGGVKSSGLIGVDLSAQTGYSTKTQIDVSFPKTGHPLCGLTGKPGGTPGLLQIHSTIL